MKIYHYDSITKEYRGSSEASLDPLELELNKKGIYMLPANTTFEEPPECPDGKMIVIQFPNPAQSIDPPWWKVVDIPKPPEPEPVPEPTKEELETQEKETLIQAKIRELAITALKAEGKMDKDGKVKK